MSQIKPKNTTLKSTDELRTAMHHLIEQARKKGATDAEVCIDQDKGFSVDVRLKSVETVSFSDAQTMTLVFYIGNQKGAASTSDLSPQALNNIVDAACHIAKMSAADPCFGLPEKELMSHEKHDLDLYHPWDITPEQAIQLAITCEEAGFAHHPAIVNSEGVNVSSYIGCMGFANTHGAEGIIYSTRHQMSCSLLAEGADKKPQRDYGYTVSRSSKGLLSPTAVAQQAAERTIQRLNARQIPTQKTAVLFDARIAPHIILSFISGISGSALYRKQTFLTDSIGQKLFPDWCHFQEYPYLPQALGSSPFDAEGVQTRENVFLTNGTVQQYVLSSYSARRLGLKTTANAGGVHNLTVTTNAPDALALMKTMKKGLWVTELMGQGVNLQTGDYSRGICGFWVENGEIQFPVEGVTIAGNLREMYRQIIGIGADVDPNHATRCGSILIDGMMVAGE